MAGDKDVRLGISNIVETIPFKQCREAYFSYFSLLAFLVVFFTSLFATYDNANTSITTIQTRINSLRLLNNRLAKLS